MIEPHRLERQGENNQNSTQYSNDRSLNTLSRAIAFSLGQFSLILVRCNYARLQKQILQRLRELSRSEDKTRQYNIREITLGELTTTLYTTIGTQLRDEQPQALMVFGLESVTALEDLLTSTNQVRDEFRKRFSFPLVLWVNDRVLQKLVWFAPDFTSWAATPIKFEIPTDELIESLRQNADSIFATILDADARFVDNSTINLEVGSRRRLELEFALRDLQSRGVQLEPQLKAALEFVQGRDAYANDRIDPALAHYLQSLAFWQCWNEQTCSPNHLQPQGAVLFHIGLCYCRHADLRLAESRHYWEEARYYLQQCVNVFDTAGRQDLVCKFINQLGDVLRRLEAWDELQALAQKSLLLHQNSGNLVLLAQDYGFLAEVALEGCRWEEALELAILAIDTLEQSSARLPQYQSLYFLLLARSQQQLGQLSEAVKNLEIARTLGNPQYDPRQYIRILKVLRSVYFEQRQYHKAFCIKQEERSIEYQYRFRAFIGAARLRPQRQAVNPAQTNLDHPGTVAQEIAASGRQQDVNRLIERLTRSDHKLIIIHGQSGVGKSSIVDAGLVPALKHISLGTRDPLPVVLPFYTDWVGTLGKFLSEALQSININLSQPLDSTEIILEQLRKNDERNLLTILIFDQFEEFFFAWNNPVKRIKFYEFLQRCLNISYVKVIISLREDYLHYLLEWEHLTNLDIIDNNILDRKIRYYFGNFSPEDARAVIESLTERSQFYLEPALVDELVRDLARELGQVRPIELQVVGAQLQTENITTLETYYQLGPKEKLVEKFLEEVIKDCGSENENAARLVLFLLTEENGTRPIKNRAELAAELGTEAEKLDLILYIFVKSGLVYSFPETPNHRYQLVHDYLVNLIRQQEQLSIRAELERLRARDKLSQAEIEQLRSELREKQLLEELAKAREKQEKIENRLNQLLKTALAGSVSAVFILTALVFSVESQRKQAEISRIKGLSASSEALVASNREFDGLLESLRVGKELKQAAVAEADTQLQVVTTLQTAVYSVKERNRLEEHLDWVNSVNFSPDGQIIASASWDKTVKLWRKDGSLIKNLSGHTAKVYSVIFSPDGQIIASASEDKTVKIWGKNGKLLKTILGHTADVYSVSFSPDGKIIASTSEDKTVKIWEINGKLLKTIKEHKAPVLSVSFSPDGQIIATVSADKTVKLWRRDGSSIKTLNGHTAEVYSVNFSTDGQRIVTASADRTVKLWRRDGNLLVTLKGHTQAVTSTSFSPDSQIIASASADGSLKIWRKNGNLLTTLTGHSGRVLGVTFSPDSQIIASASADGSIKLWHRHPLSLKIMKGHSKPLTSISFSSDGKIIASTSEDTTVKLWRNDGILMNTLQGHTQPVTSISFDPLGQIIASTSEDKTVKLWRNDGSLLKTIDGHDAPVWSVIFSPDGRIMASASEDKTVKLWGRDGKLLRTITGHEGAVWGVRFSPDGKTLASASQDGTVRLCKDLACNVSILLKGHIDEVNWTSFSPDGQTIASASKDGTVKLWNLEGKEINTFKGHIREVNWVSFSPDGQTLASGGEDGTVKLWSLDGKKRKSLRGHKGAVLSVSFSPDGKMLASASADRTIILWNLDLDDLLVRGCEWVSDYLKNNPNVDESVRKACR